MPRTSSEIQVELPEQGAGALAPTGRRVLGFVIDLAASFLVGCAFTAPSLPRNVSLLVFGVEYFLLTTLTGQSAGMFLTRIRVVRVDRAAPLGPVRALVRTVGLMLLVPALIWDRDSRGLHDRLSQSAVVLA